MNIKDIYFVLLLTAVVVNCNPVEISPNVANPPGTFGENVTSMDECTACPSGYYCPEGSVLPLPCPAGTYGNTIGMASMDQCTPCPPGLYCSNQGATAPDGPCSAGYYCREGSTTPDHNICPSGYYCPTGSSAPILCPLGTDGPISAMDHCLPCPPGYYCPTDCKLSLDIMFVLDGSASVGTRNFETVKDWVINVAKEFETEAGSIQVGVIQYSYWYRTKEIEDQPFLKVEIPLDIYSKEDFEAKMNDIKLQGYQTYTAHAMNRTVVEFKKSSRYDDKKAIKAMILVTDGMSTDKDDLPTTVDFVQSLNISTFAIGIGNVVKQELNMIANGDENNNDNVFYVENFADLPTIVDPLRGDIRALTLMDSSALSPCPDGTTSLTGATSVAECKSL